MATPSQPLSTSTTAALEQAVRELHARLGQSARNYEGSTEHTNRELLNHLNRLTQEVSRVTYLVRRTIGVAKIPFRHPYSLPLEEVQYYPGFNLPIPI